MKLTSKRITLRMHKNEDAYAFKEMLKDEIARKYTGGTVDKTIEEIIEYFKKLNTGFTSELNTIISNKNNFEFAIVNNIDSKYIGYCGIQYCETLNGLELLYGLKREYWGQGLAFEAANTVIQYSFKHLSLDIIEAVVNPENIASEKILIKCGFRYVRNIEWPNQGKVKKYKMDKEIWLTTTST